MEIVKVNVMYRDASNYKEYGESLFKNKESLSLEQIKEAFEPLMDEPIMVQYYGIESIAPLSSEFLPAYGDDHAFCEIVGVELIEGSGTNLKDIREVLELIEKGGDADVIGESLSSTIKKLESHISDLTGVAEHLGFSNYIKATDGSSRKDYLNRELGLLLEKAEEIRKEVEQWV